MKVVSQLNSAVSLPGRSGIVADLEEALQDYFDVRHAITTSSPAPPPCTPPTGPPVSGSATR
ncbi:hypothetical protein [Streptomyces sp. NRRL S-1448]|uniref:hypothetical protein n=1 Tax=Streptomyces sp. NRRL S-1448 TaxID=1463883 RepID=UPI000A6F5893|nr:hypothetical protein [Streptomyces sp. NRRL S-1448]